MTQYSLFATTPKAMENLLADELKSLGAENVKPTLAGVAFTGNLTVAYRVCLWSRLANRVFLTLAKFAVHNQQDLYEQVQKINWFLHLKPDDSLAVSFNVKNSKAINNSHFGALKVKDAIVDQMRTKFQKRPNIDTERPSIRVNVYLEGEQAELSLDLSGDSLHMRGFREVSIAAPIKENLAAAILIRSGWPQIAVQHGTLIDPMCGSGTLLIEAAMIAADFAPGLLRNYYGFFGWKQHDAEIWQTLVSEAQQRKAIGLQNMPAIVGFDQDRRTVAIALQHVQNAGLQDFIHVERREISAAKPAASWQTGLIICNPPYGERLGDEAATAQLYQQFGTVLKNQFQGWQAALIISNPELGFQLGIRSQKPITFFNGALECKLLRLSITESAFFLPKTKNQDQRIDQIQQLAQHLSHDSGAQMFANRLRKNLKNLSKWAKQQQIKCYRIYDADLPEYAVAVDIYQGEKLWVHVQEYEAPKTIDSHKTNQRLGAVLAVLPEVLQIEPAQVFLKIRRKQKQTDQYQKHNHTAHFHIVEEGQCKFWVNFEDYLDIGLFLDHRPMRLLIGQEAKGKRFLNLFAYTGTATIHAAKGGAESTLTVDMSATYLDWAQRNLILNQLSGQHQFIQADCVEWLAHTAQQKHCPQFELIFLDPPTFSNSKRMDDVLDVQRDHVALIQHAAKLLTPEGILYFSTNFRRFKLDAEALNNLVVTDMSTATIPPDFARDSKIHYCWRIQLA